MTDRNISSEEKLLKLIRKKNQSGDRRQDPQDPKEDAVPVRKEWKKDLNALGIINVFLVVSFLGLLTYMIVRFLAPRDSGGDHVIVKDEADRKNTDVAVEPMADLKDFSSYGPVLDRRDIFNVHFEKQPVGTNAAIPDNTYDPRRTLRLVGIILDEQEQVIVEDTELKQTFFLHIGEKVNDITVKGIQENKVIFNYQGQDFELELISSKFPS